MRRKTSIILTLLGSVWGFGGCAFDEGRGFARLSADLSGAFEALSPAGEIRTDNDFDVSLVTLSLEVRAVAVYGGQASSATAECRFDPANPPEGCSLCHGGHCHCDDALVSYEDLEARVCGASSSPTSTLLVRLGGGPPPFDLLTEHAPRMLESCSPHCELGRGEVQEVRLELGALALGGTIRDAGTSDRFAGDEPSISITTDLHGTSIVAPLEHALVVDRDTPYGLHLELDFALAAQLLDGIAWEALQRVNDAIVVDAQHNEHTAHALAANLEKSALHVHVWRDGVEEEEHHHEEAH